MMISAVAEFDVVTLVYIDKNLSAFKMGILYERVYISNRVKNIHHIVYT
jgi:hypothetical protein